MASAITFCRLRSSVSGCSSDDRYSVDAVSPISNSRRSSFIEHQLEDEGDDVIGLVSAVTTATGAKQTSQSATHRFVFESNKRLRWSGCCSVVEHRAHLSALFYEWCHQSNHREWHRRRRHRRQICAFSYQSAVPMKLAEPTLTINVHHKGRIDQSKPHGTHDCPLAENLKPIQSMPFRRRRPSEKSMTDTLCPTQQWTLTRLT